ncbi:MAG: peptidase M50 [Pseudomonadota bacterium]
MTGPVFSQNWFKVAGLRPRLRPHVRIYRHVYRGSPWFVVRDEQSGRYHRLSPAANRMIGLMDGRRTMDAIWAAANEWDDDGDPPTQDETIRMLAHLHQSDLLAGDAPPDVEELAHRAVSRETKALTARLKNPLALRLPLWDPDRFLTATMPFARPVFSLFGALVWLAVVLGALVLAALNWSELTTGIVDQVLLAENLVVLALVYPVVKVVHELAHGYAVKRWGGTVHEMGLMFLVLIPVPYVDASASNGFSGKWARATVGAAGILAELFIASIAMFVWVQAEPGLVRAAAFNAMLIGGVSTLLFNGNPLLRFDAYYVLSDLIEIPNLGNRANSYFFYLIKRYLFGMRRAVSPVTARGERAWFLFYSVAAFLYRMIIMISIAIFVAGMLFFVGVALAIWTVFNALALPVLKGLWWLVEAPELREKRSRAIGVSAALAAVVCGALFAAPAPYATVAEGVVDVPERAVLRTLSEGFVSHIAEGGDVAAGAEVVALSNDLFLARRDLLVAQRDELRLKLARDAVNDRLGGALLREQLEQADATIARIDEQIAGLSLRSARDGVLIVPDKAALEGNFAPRGALVGYLIAPGDLIVRAAVPQATSELVRSRLTRVEIVLADRPSEPLEAEIVREVPKAGNRLPSPVLGAQGGGALALDPTAGDAVTTLDPFFQFDLRAPLSVSDAQVGQRVYVRFDHGEEPIYQRIARGVRQLFLRQFDV